jgi:hypothetical protein
MPFEHAKSLRYYTFDSLNNLPLTHGLFTRQGGVSEAPFAHLNVGSAVGDSLESVQQNIAHIFTTFNLPRVSLFDSRLVHGTNAIIAEDLRHAGQEGPPDADIILTKDPEVTLFMRYADCLPLLLHDPVQQAIGLAHAGWKGTVQRVAAKAVEEMEKQFGSNATDLIAAIGPGICAEHYEVGSNVISEVESAFGQAAANLLPSRNGSTHFDLFAANVLALKEVGVERIESSGICTASNTEDWFSHRAEHGRTGRFGALLTLKKQ